MTALLALVPILLSVVLLLAKQRAWVSAVIGMLTAAILTPLAFPTSWSTLRTAGADYFPLILEVALILLFGMTLARLLEASGAMREISSWVEGVAPSRPLGVGLVVFGIVPFAESVTGFGIGVTIGVPILRHLGCSLRQSALLGLLGLIAVPWGALGPGTTVAAALANLDVDELGLETAWLNAIPVLIVTTAVILVMRPGPGSLLGIVCAAALMWSGILVANMTIGMAPAGIIGTLLVIVALGTVFTIRKRHTGFTAALGRAMIPYGVLTAGLLIARAVAAALPSTVADIIASPPFWLGVACVIAAGRMGTNRTHGASSESVDSSAGTEPSRPPSRRTTVLSSVRSWVPIGSATAAFMLMGWIMTTTEMSTAIGSLVPVGLVFLAPWLTTIGSVLTGSNTGANSMFTGTLDAVAQASNTSSLTVIAAGNAAGSLAALATPPRVAMAVQMADSHAAASTDDTGWVQSRALIICALNALAIGLWLQFMI